ncbi:MAG TPA: protein kinase [Pyrinomonadaceae bacterium]|nr:protein kinase [Pyrinomonadaceae bacterium]
MTPERYRRAEEIFHSALECEAEARAAFLAEACRGDAALRAEVEALIAAHERPDFFLDAPAYELAAETLAGERADSLVGQHVGRYEVLELIGSGGMGDVYLARDTRLGRKVALKFLPDYLADDAGRVRRFEQEARAASALNHPNILTIYEIGQSDARYFIATEFIDGSTLRERIQGGPMRADDALEVASQVASALAKAHQAGIVHRDVKPENIMLDADGRAKVLDFGLAKFTPHLNAGGASATASTLYTAPGLVIGTTAYMSPEQARGREVDARTDIWSLGCVLYEMVTGRPPFGGETRADVLAAVLEREPEPLAGATPPVPAELQRITKKALQKDREKRYQTSKDLALDLENLRRELDADTKEISAPKPGRRKTRALALALTAGLLLAAAVFAGIRWWPSRGPEAAAPAAVAPAPAPAPERRLAYSITVQKYRNGKPYQDPFRLAGEINFERDYRVRLNVSSAQPGHLYVLNEGPAEPGQGASPYVVLFPSPTANNGLSLIAAGQEVQIPEQSWFVFDAEEGTEKVWLVWSAESVPALEAVRGFANRQSRGLVSEPRLNAAVREFLQSHASPAPAAVKDEARKEIVLTAKGDILAHVLRLEHH